MWLLTRNSSTAWPTIRGEDSRLPRALVAPGHVSKPRVYSYYWILRAFQSPSGSIGSLVSGLETLRNLAKDLSLYGSFLENHDVERFAYFTKDMVSISPLSFGVTPTKLTGFFFWTGIGEERKHTLNTRRASYQTGH